MEERRKSNDKRIGRRVEEDREGGGGRADWGKRTVREERERERENSSARKRHEAERDWADEPKEGINREAREKSNGWIG